MLKSGCIRIFLAYLFCVSVSIAAEKGTIIPLYIYPKTENGGDAWQPLLDAYTQYPIEVWAIINVNSGPGNGADSNYDSAISNLKSVGINTLGYVSTDYARRDKSLIMQDIDLWKSLYGPTGIFLDEMTSDNNPSNVQFYEDLNSYCKSQGFTFTVGNPGTYVSQEYLEAVDTAMIFENAGFPDVTTICNNKYHNLADLSALGIFPYDVQQLNETSILKAKECVGYIYTTNDNGSNPWDTLPSYLPQLFEILSR